MHKRRTPEYEHHYIQGDELHVENDMYEGPERRIDQYSNTVFQVLNSELNGLREIVDRGFDSIKDRIRELQRMSDYRDDELRKLVARLNNQFKTENDSLHMRLNKLESELPSKIQSAIEGERHKRGNKLLLWIAGVVGTSVIGGAVYILRDVIGGLF